MQSIEALALFPLSDVVLLPQVSVPLFIFEPRYRQMTREALDGSRQIGMVAVRPDAVAEMKGDPAIFDVGCIGHVTHAEERPDGTFQILLVGEKRFRIQEEHERSAGRLYRSARVEVLEDVEPANEDERAHVDSCRDDVLVALERLATRSRGDESAVSQLAALSSLESTRLINALAQSIALDPIERQQLLEANSILARFEIMEDLLRFRIAETGGSELGSRSLPN